MESAYVDESFPVSSFSEQLFPSVGPGAIRTNLVSGCILLLVEYGGLEANREL